MNARVLSRAAGVFAFVSTALSAGAALGGEPKIPEWTRDARWYQVDLDRFYNGDSANDPAGTAPWASGWAAVPQGQAQPGERIFGGDIAGLRSKLSYIRKAGLNALWLSPIFSADLRHVDNRFGVKVGSSTAEGEGAETGARKPSASDRAFLGFLEEAHKKGVHVIVDAGPAAEAKQLLDAAQWWMDPDGNGDPADGIDGWVLRWKDKSTAALGKRLRERVKKINPNAIVVADMPEGGAESPEAASFDAVVSYAAGKAIRRFLGGQDKSYTPQKFLADLESLNKGRDLQARLATLNAVSGPEVGRMLSAFISPGSGSSSSKPTEASYDKWRLATVLHHFFIGAPVVYYGDEVGMYGAAGPAARAPMWWDDPRVRGPKPAEYRRELMSLIRLLNLRRERQPPLRHGDFRTVLADEKEKILAFGRALPGHEIIPVVNYGNEKRKVELSVGKPGQVIGLLAPQLKPSPGVKTLLMGGSRQQADESGKISIWVKPMAVRIVVVDETEGRRGLKKKD
jgi:glycosidase